LRADARRNRARLLAVAENVFAAQGPSASTEDIAAAANVGIGTLFRHFPTKEALLEAVFVERLRHLAEDANHLASAPDSGEAFFSFFRSVLDQAKGKSAIADALSHAGIDVKHSLADVKNDLNLGLERLLLNAQHAGAVRPDVTLPELLALLVGAARALEHLGSNTTLADRTLTIILDGLRPRGPASQERQTESLSTAKGV
jgi:AcrR family transcriptional regulator